MKRAVIRFECGDKVQEFYYPYRTTEETANNCVRMVLPVLAKRWKVPQENIEVEIRYVIRLK